jgi:hypothetical protein
LSPFFAPAKFEIDLEWPSKRSKLLIGAEVFAGPMNNAIVVQHVNVIDRATTPYLAADMAFRSRWQNCSHETVVDVEVFHDGGGQGADEQLIGLVEQ